MLSIRLHWDGSMIEAVRTDYRSARRFTRRQRDALMDAFEECWRINLVTTTEVMTVSTFIRADWSASSRDS